MLKQFTSLLATVTVASTAYAGADFSNVIAQPSGLEATAAYGPVGGNDKEAIVLDLLNDEAFGGSDVFGVDLHWSLAGKSDDGGAGPFKQNVETSTGTLEFDSAMTGPFAITLKSANLFSIYYFDASFAGTTSVDFDTIGTSEKNGKGRGLSHASLFTATSPTGVPSPTAALAGLGLMGLLVTRRGRRK